MKMCLLCRRENYNGVRKPWLVCRQKYTGKEIIETIGSHALKANTDTGNFLLVGEKPFDAVKNLVNNIGFVHFKDFKK